MKGKGWVFGLMLISISMLAQNQEDHIKRDIEVAENVLSTLLRQQLGRRAQFWGLEVNGKYTPGYGVILKIPYDRFNLGLGMDQSEHQIGEYQRELAIWAPHVTTTIIDGSSLKEFDEFDKKDLAQKEKLKEKKTTARDSVRAIYIDKMIAVSKEFLADYGDLIGINPEEKIIITTKSDNRDFFPEFGGMSFKRNRNIFSMEAIKSDLTQYKQSKITRDQLFTRIKVFKTETTNEPEPDLELLSSILNQLYRPDLSKTFFIGENPYYERIKDFGVIYNIQVYSSNLGEFNRFNMPTQGLENIDLETKDKKVKELYPQFEKEIKENMLDYGRTLKSLKDNELLVFDIKLTKCVKCGIPSTLELSVKASILKEFSLGKLTKEAALTKISEKKGPAQ